MLRKQSCIHGLERKLCLRKSFFNSLVVQLAKMVNFM